MLLQGNTTAGLGTKHRWGWSLLLPLHGSLRDKALSQASACLLVSGFLLFHPQSEAAMLPGPCTSRGPKVGVHQTISISARGDGSSSPAPINLSVERQRCYPVYRCCEDRHPQTPRMKNTMPPSRRQPWGTCMPWERRLRHAGMTNSIRKKDTTPPGTAKSLPAGPSSTAR